MIRIKLIAMATMLTVALLFLAFAQAAENKAAQSGKVNINTATVEQLMALPGIGKVVAQRIIEYRTKNGPFKRIEDLMGVKGIGEKKFQRLKDQITV